MRQRRTPEFWAEVRRLVEAGLSLKKASVRFGLAYSYLVQKAQWQGWKLCYSGRPRTKDDAEATRRRIQQAKEETQYAEAEAELERKATILTIDLREAQNLTNRVLSTHSMKLKTMLSELSVKVAESLYTTEMRPKDVALTLVSLKVVGEHLHRWSEEPSVAQTEQKKNWAINIPLQCTPRERLKELAIASNGAVAPEPMHKDLSLASNLYAWAASRKPDSLTPSKKAYSLSIQTISYVWPTKNTSR